MPETDFTLHPIGYVRSTLKEREEAPRQGNEGAPDAWIDLDPALAEGLDGIAQGDALISPRITRRLISEFAARQDPQEPPEALRELTGRERDVLRLVAQGLSNDEIAGRLVISPLTAKTHVRNILGKLGCRDRAGLVALAYESGLIVPGAGSAAP